MVIYSLNPRLSGVTYRTYPVGNYRPYHGKKMAKTLVSIPIRIILQFTTGIVFTLNSLILH